MQTVSCVLKKNHTMCFGKISLPFIFKESEIKLVDGLFLTLNPIRSGLSSDFRDKTSTFISYNYKARDFEPWFPGKAVVYLPESGVALCTLWIFSVHIPWGSSNQAALAVCSSLVSWYQHLSFKLRPCKVQPISVLNSLHFTYNKQRT